MHICNLAKRKLKVSFLSGDCERDDALEAAAKTIYFFISTVTIVSAFHDQFTGCGDHVCVKTNEGCVYAFLPQKFAKIQSRRGKVRLGISKLVTSKIKCLYVSPEVREPPSWLGGVGWEGVGSGKKVKNPRI